MKYRPPIIIIGMHRSGTSMLTRFMTDLGVFMGKDKSENDESLFFQNLNRWLLFQMGASWDFPEAVNSLNPEFVKNAAHATKLRLKSIPTYKYLGIGRYLANKNIAKNSKIWGWKDPRNTFV